MGYTRKIVSILLLVVSVNARAQDVPYGNNPAAGHYMNVDGTKIYYEIYGEEKPLVMLHGVYGYIDEYRPFIPKDA